MGIWFVINSEFETVRSLSDYSFEGKVEVTAFTSTKKGNVSLIPYEGSYNAKLNGIKGGKYTFELTDEKGNVYFKYYFDKEKNTVVLNNIG